jgi:hypothetical protein
MPSNKNQHFVPRCYLRAFSVDSSGLVINLFNLDRCRAIPNAPLKSQCSKNYFYGEDLRLERALQGIEGSYASMLSEITQPGYRLTTTHRQQLKDFWCLQHLRTEAIARRAVVAAEQMLNDIEGQDSNYRLTMRESIEMSVGMVPTIAQGIRDLRLCLIRNETILPFITSDDPAISANRWYQQDVRARNIAPGLASAGALLFLPLTPNILCLIYDGNVYSIPQRDGWATINSAKDIGAFNEHQYLGAFANVYFSNWDAQYLIEEAFAAISARRPTTRYRFHYAILDRVEANAEVFREVSAAEAREHQRSIVHQEAVYPVPTSWPRLIRYRPDGHVWFNGSGGGYSRWATVPSARDAYIKYPSRRGR